MRIIASDRPRHIELTSHERAMSCLYALNAKNVKDERARQRRAAEKLEKAARAKEESR